MKENKKNHALKNKDAESFKLESNFIYLCIYLSINLIS